MSKPMNTSYDSYIFLVQTDKYAGNFEREMCAYMTGVTGDCRVGHREAEKFHEDMEAEGNDKYLFDGFVGHQPDDHGCYRPVSITSIDGNQNKSFEIYFDAEPTDYMVSIMLTRALAYAIKKGIGLQGTKLYRKTVSTRYKEVVT